MEPFCFNHIILGLYATRKGCLRYAACMHAYFFHPDKNSPLTISQPPSHAMIHPYDLPLIISKTITDEPTCLLSPMWISTRTMCRVAESFGCTSDRDPSPGMPSRAHGTKPCGADRGDGVNQ